MVPQAILIAVLAALPYLLLDPPNSDLAAQIFRAELWEREGFVLWSPAWYGGHHIPGYSLTYPPLAALVGVRAAGAVGVVTAAGAFAAIAERRFGSGARLGVWWFAAATATMLYTGRLTFGLGVGVGMLAALAASRRRPAVGGVLAAVTALTSPVAGLFVALGGAALWLGAADYRREAAGLALGSGLALGGLTLAFPDGGVHPFVFSSFVAVPLFAAAALVAIPGEHRVLRIGVALYALLALTAFVVPSQLGGNVVRLGALAGGPLLALVLWPDPRRRMALAALALPLLYWQWVAPARELIHAPGDPSTEAAYHEPLLAELDRRTAGRVVRVHVPPTRNRWEAAYVAERYLLARGWLRQLESDDFDLFTDGELTAEGYRRWLDEHGVELVAVSGAPPDYLARDERELIASGLPYLTEVWSSPDWRLYRVAGARNALVDGPGRLIELGADGYTLLHAGGPEVAVGVRHSPYHRVVEGEACLEPADDRGGGRWTRVHLPPGASPGTMIRVEARASLRGLLRRSSRCDP